MRKVFVFILFAIFIIAHTGMVSAAEKAPQKVVDLVNSTLVNVGTDPVIVEAVKA